MFSHLGETFFLRGRKESWNVSHRRRWFLFVEHQAVRRLKCGTFPAGLNKNRGFKLFLHHPVCKFSQFIFLNGGTLPLITRKSEHRDNDAIFLFLVICFFFVFSLFSFWCFSVARLVSVFREILKHPRKTLLTTCWTPHRRQRQMQIQWTDQWTDSSLFPAASFGDLCGSKQTHCIQTLSTTEIYLPPQITGRD